MEVTKRRFAESETSIESMQEDGRLRDRSHQLPVDDADVREMRDDYQILKQRLTGIRLDIIESRMAGESFKSIGTRHKLSKQRIHMLTVEAIEQMQRSMMG
jgi:ribosomal protein L20A (L18A)